MYTKNFRYFVIVSAVILLVGVIFSLTKGMNLGIDFTGGTIMTVEMQGEFEVTDVTAALEANDISDAPVVKSGATSGSQTQAVIRFRPFVDETEELTKQENVIKTIQEKYPNAALGGVDRVGAVASTDLIRNCLLSLVLAFALMLVYIWIRFELFSGVSALICLIHDIVIMWAFTVIFQIQINSSFIAAILTIVGYSINNTIVIFDRVRENTARFGGRKGEGRANVVNMSINQSLTRSLNTTLTTLITISCVYFLGVDSIKEFTLPIIIGLVAGTYSSVFLAAPLWNNLHLTFDKNKGVQGKKKKVRA